MKENSIISAVVSIIGTDLCTVSEYRHMFYSKIEVIGNNKINHTKLTDNKTASSRAILHKMTHHLLFSSPHVMKPKPSSP
jgi:hypothetical protein